MNDWRSDFLDAMDQAMDAMDQAIDGLEHLAGEVVTGVESWASEMSVGATKQFDRLVELSVEWSDDVATEMTDAVADVVTEVMTQVTTELSAQTQAFLDTDLDAFLNALIQPFTVESLEDWINVISVPNQYSGVPIKPHPLCANCKNFHGQAYSEVSLVCGIHPYGIADGQDGCVDREV